MATKRSAVPFAFGPHEAALAATTTRAGQADATALQFDQAMRRFETGHWSRAFEELRALANREHPAAARIALMLVRRGTSLFGGTFTATREEQARWHRCSGA